MASAASHRPIPGTPRVISPSRTPSEISLPGRDYFAPITRSVAKKSSRVSSSQPPSIPEHSADSSSDSEGRARNRSRSRDASVRLRRLSGLREVESRSIDGRPQEAVHKKPSQLALANSDTNGHLSPALAASKYWPEFSRSSSPLGLIPIHREWRSFIHRHEIPRKLLHVSIGFLTLFLYSTGVQITSIPPVLMTFLVPIAFTDLVRHNWPPFNRFYIRCLGAFMRETEAHEKYNGVIWYLLGTWTVLNFFPKDIGVASVLLLSWCDTAASTLGRLYGRYTPRLRKGKSLAGSAAAAVVGVVTALVWWGWIGPHFESNGVADNSGPFAFAYQGVLTLPAEAQELLHLSPSQASITGPAALGVLSIAAGLIASVSEAVDMFGWDDNITIPVLCGWGLWGFLKSFGSA